MKKWLIILVACMVVVILGFALTPRLWSVPVGATLAIVLGAYWAGYAASRLDPMRPKVRIQLSNDKPEYLR